MGFQENEHVFSVNIPDESHGFVVVFEQLRLFYIVLHKEEQERSLKFEHVLGNVLLWLQQPQECHQLVVLGYG